jgi:hypothetical protein
MRAVHKLLLPGETRQTKNTRWRSNNIFLIVWHISPDSNNLRPARILV